MFKTFKGKAINECDRLTQGLFNALQRNHKTKNMLINPSSKPWIVLILENLKKYRNIATIYRLDQ